MDYVLYYFPRYIVIFCIWCFVIRWIYRDFVQSQIQSKTKRFVIVFVMICSYFTEPVVAHIYAYYEFVYSVPTKDDFAHWRRKLNGIDMLRYDGGFKVMDTITSDDKVAHITREVYKSPYFLFLTIPKDESGTNEEPLLRQDLGSFDVNEINKKDRQ